MLRFTVILMCIGLLTACGSRNVAPGGTTLQSGEEIRVNRYLWEASLDTLSFLPIQSIDPFTGVIVTGYGTAPGGKTAYRATIHIRSAALSTRSLSVALMTRRGPASADTVRAVENAIFTRARQMHQGIK
ncbi:MAG: DUF3576 domain-containing protein [Planktomarina sp.]